jgi:NAD-specific glutamate dehydrogenase
MKEAIVVKELSRYFPEGAEEDHSNPVRIARLSTEIIAMQVYSVTAL